MWKAQDNHLRTKMQTTKKERFIGLIDEHKKIIYKIVNSYCANPADRKDLEQEIIIQLWDAFDKYNPEFKYSTWMYRIALNTAISYYRKEKKWHTKTDSFDNATIFHLRTEETEHREQMNKKVEMLQHFIQSLNELNKALMLLYLEEKSHSEIAEILGISKTNVATKIGRIKLKLKNEFLKNLNYETE
ncbi:RNA polymerase sigma factor [Zobellia alginiliquefaciens]|uniref:RNA polymerase sigma factor n=1 Tax=Zobellia alginiliquefaciens TaxID=3032586 RepID=UPI0023E46AE0|nr:sigma-70 family RNA polymerase sigma factor [Zobellia alginiliquefaciens]